MTIPFSIVTSVYKNDKPKYVKIALDSMLVNQTIKPTEIILVVDGPINTELTNLINSYQEKYNSTNIFRKKSRTWKCFTNRS